MQKFTLALVIVLAAGLFLYERNQSRAWEATVQALNHDRDTLEQEVETLTRLMLKAKEREDRIVTAAFTKPAVAAAEAKPLATPPAAEPAPVPGVTTKAPMGWSKNGSRPNSYVVGVDENQTHDGVPSAYIQSVEGTTDGFGGMMQTISAEDYLGKRVRLSGWMKTEEANQGGGHLWLRVDGQQSQLQFDNMNNRAPKGTTDWQPYSVVLDVPANANALAYGAFLDGGGKMWVNSPKMELVDETVPSTNMIKPRQNPALPKAPVNLGFGH